MNIKANVCQFLIGILVISGCSGRKNPPQLPETNRLKVENRPDSHTTANPTSESDTLKNKSSVTSQAGKWMYKEAAGTTGKIISTASVTSGDVLNFAPPFNGGSTLTLTIRNRKESITVLLSVSKGQFTSSFQGGKVRIRFDNKPSAIYSFSAAGDGSTDVIFFDDAPALLRQLKAARKTVIDAGFYGHGIRPVAFRTANLRWRD